MQVPKPLSVALAAIVVLAACTSSSGSTPPSSTEARIALDRIVRLAQQGDFDALCRTADGEANPTCAQVLAEAGRDVPSEPPTVIAEQTTPPGEHVAAGRILTICGHGDDGSVYQSELLFFFSSGRIDVVQPIWWSGFQVDQGAPGPVPGASTNAGPKPGCG